MRYILLLTVFIIPALASASPPSGFHKGPYFMLSGGAFNFTADNNVRTDTKVGHDIEPAVGFNFGWNLTDRIAPEFQVQYSNNNKNDRREHIVNVGLDMVYSFVAEQLTSSESIKLLPFVQIGPMAQFSAMPGDAASSDKTMSVWGPGFNAGAGGRIMFKQYGYAGITAYYNFVVLPDKFQDIGGAETKVMKGGMSAQFGAVGTIGVHF